jgi:hypothetical protein
MKTGQSRYLNLAKNAIQDIERGGRRDLGARSQKEQRSAKLPGALRALYDILESHAPTWYRQEHHKRAEHALRTGGKFSAEAFVELSDLLEVYAPRWYTKENHERTQSVLKALNKR